jgi:hypothetical protein
MRNVLRMSCRRVDPSAGSGGFEEPAPEHTSRCRLVISPSSVIGEVATDGAEVLLAEQSSM